MKSTKYKAAYLTAQKKIPHAIIKTDLGYTVRIKNLVSNWDYYTELKGDYVLIFDSNDKQIDKIFCGKKPKVKKDSTSSKVKSDKKDKSPEVQASDKSGETESV